MDAALFTAARDSENSEVVGAAASNLRGAMAGARMNLAALPSSVEASVVGVHLGGCLGDRLVELGFTVGAPIRVLRRAPFGGPLQVQIREFILSLRREQAAAISVQVKPAQAARNA